MAFFTFLLAWLGSIARLGTVLVESDDLLFRLQYITGCVLNTLIVLQFALYWNAPKQATSKTAPRAAASPAKRDRKNKLE